MLKDIIEDILQNPIFYIIPCALLYYIVRKIKIFIRNKRFQNDEIELDRDIVNNIKYNPSVLGILNDGEIYYRELLADIMNLYSKKVITLDKDEQLKFYNLKLVDPTIEMTESDRYIIKTLVNKKEEFDFVKWKTNVIEECQKLDFIKVYQNKKTEDERILSDFLEIIAPFAIFFLIMIILWLVASIITLSPIEGLRNNFKVHGGNISFCSYIRTFYDFAFIKKKRKKFRVD